MELEWERSSGEKNGVCVDTLARFSTWSLSLSCFIEKQEFLGRSYFYYVD
jgi:hypothetical protein